MADERTPSVASPSNTAEIELALMPQQSGIRASSEDWTGVTDRAKRRKLQNLLNQRAYRLRRQDTTNKAIDGKRERRNNKKKYKHDDTLTFGRITKDPQIHCPSDLQERMHRFEALAIQSYLNASPDLSHLISLCKLNVQRAIHDNILTMGMTKEWLCADEIVSIFNQASCGFSEESIPPSLRPTALQRATPHHPWLDTFPFPQMRDNLISRTSYFDDDELCHDLMAFWDTRNTEATLLVWGPPWDPSNWEVTEAFARKWGWILKGCPDLLIYTNRWRVRRGEKPLSWSQILMLGKITTQDGKTQTS
ncbi:hypothetical protein DTO212C5_6164 [Paecilomyces variotii]|nr:hypothetical protein DTO212C5_6164 [Paecilomyces variotii]